MIQKENNKNHSSNKNLTIEQRISLLGERLGKAIRDVVDDIPDAPEKAVELSTFLGIDKTLSVRLIGAIKKKRSARCLSGTTWSSWIVDFDGCCKKQRCF